MAGKNNTLIYLVRRDSRVSDNPILHHLASSSDHGFTHVLPVLIIAPHQIEVSGLLRDGTTSPYPEARSETGRYWRCGPHRAKFIAHSIWNMKQNLGKLGSDLIIRVGRFDEIIEQLVDDLGQNDNQVGAVWMIHEEGYEEGRDEKTTSKTCSSLGIDYQSWVDEKFFVDDRDVGLENPQALPDVYTTYRKMMEPLREKPRQSVPRPAEGSLPGLPSTIPDQAEPFQIPDSLGDFEKALVHPVMEGLPVVPQIDDVEAHSAHPLLDGEDGAQRRLDYYIRSGNASAYKSSRNGLLGVDFSTKLSAYLAQGCITARQVHEALMAYEDGKASKYAEAPGYGKGENEGTTAIRLELLWRDYMRLCTKKFQNKLYQRSGFRDDHSHKWKTARAEDVTEVQKSQGQSTEDISRILDRWVEGRTGQSLIDASQRELIHTGYTSNRARQNVAGFLAKHMEIDWRYGAEWYEMLLVDYDVSSNWSNWQYVAGVGNDPRGQARIFNPVKQAFDYDKTGEYVRTWVPELAQIEKLENLFQPWTTPREDWEKFNLDGVVMAEHPLKKIDFSVEGKPKSSRRPFHRRRGPGRGSAPNAGSQSRGQAQGQPQQQPQEQQQPQVTQQGPQGRTSAHGGPPVNSPKGPQHGNGGGGYRGGRGAYRGGFYGRGYGIRGGRGTQWQQQGHSPVAMGSQPWTHPHPTQ
ncbi:putative cryptochrome [Xylariaceae sp. FL0804]|nr:putative cryptochrome [Xylariaceae sp. FL0804]